MTIEFQKMRTRDLQAQLRKRGIDPSKFLLREELLATLQAALAEERLNDRRETITRGLWKLIVYVLLPLVGFMILGPIMRPHMSSQWFQLRVWAVTKRRYFARALRLRRYVLFSFNVCARFRLPVGKDDHSLIGMLLKQHGRDDWIAQSDNIGSSNALAESLDSCKLVYSALFALLFMVISDLSFIH